MSTLKKQQKEAQLLSKLEKRGHQGIVLLYSISCVNKVLWFTKFSYIHHNEVKVRSQKLYLLSAC